jgi:hypothetical protein
VTASAIVPRLTGALRRLEAVKGDLDPAQADLDLLESRLDLVILRVDPSANGIEPPPELILGHARFVAHSAAASGTGTP